MTRGDLFGKLKGVILDHKSARALVLVLAGFVGWMAGTLVYFGILIVTFNPPEAGDIHVGVLPLSLIGIVVAVRLTRRWMERAMTARSN